MDIKYLIDDYRKNRENFNEAEEIVKAFTSQYWEESADNTEEVLLKEVLCDYNISDFFDTLLRINDKEYLFKDVFIKLKHASIKKVITIEHLEKEYNKNPDSCFELIKILNSKDILTDEMIKFTIDKFKLGEHISPSYTEKPHRMVEELLLTIHSFYTLKKFENAGFNVWIPIVKGNNIETLLPCIVSDKELVRRDLDKLIKTSALKRADFIIENKNKWNNIETDKTDKKTFLDRVVINISAIPTDKEFMDRVKILGLTGKKLNLLTKDFLGNNEYSGYEVLVARKKYNIVKNILKSKTDVDSTESIKIMTRLVQSEPNRMKVNKNTIKAYKELWKLLDERIPNYNLKIENKTIINSVLNKDKKTNICNNKLFIPINLNDLEVESNYKDISFNESRAKSLEKLIEFLEKKNFNFFITQPNTFRPLLSDILLYSLSKNIDNLDFLFGNNSVGFVERIMKQADNDTLFAVWDNFIEDWPLIFNEDRKNSFKFLYGQDRGSALSLFVNKTSIRYHFIDMIKLFKENLFLQESFNDIDGLNIIKDSLNEFRQVNHPLDYLLSDLEKIMEFKTVNNNLTKKSNRIKVTNKI